MSRFTGVPSEENFLFTPKGGHLYFFLQIYVQNDVLAIIAFAFMHILSSRRPKNAESAFL